MHLGRGRGSAYPECITHIGAKRIGINKSCVVSHRGALRSAETRRGLGPRISACGSDEVAPARLTLTPFTDTSGGAAHTARLTFTPFTANTVINSFATAFSSPFSEVGFRIDGELG